MIIKSLAFLIHHIVKIKTYNSNCAAEYETKLDIKKITMKKQEWQDLHRTLNDILLEFLREYHNYKDGKNKKIRTEAENKIYNSISLADNLVNSS